MEVKVLSYNIHKGFDFFNRKFLLSDIKEAIQSFDADIVLLQEVQGQNTLHQQKIINWPNESQFEFLADQIWPHFSYGQNAVYNHGHHGNAILSKFPILWNENIDISTNPFEKRGLLHTTIKAPSWPREMHILNGHLNLLEGGRQIQLQTLCQRVREHVPAKAPLIMGGDFNDWGQKASTIIYQQLHSLEVFQTLFQDHAKTFPSFYPLLKLDRLYYNNLQALFAQVLKGEKWNRLSDHLPIGAIFSLDAT